MKSDYVSSKIKDEWTCGKHSTWGKIGTRCIECHNEELKSENHRLKEEIQTLKRRLQNETND